MVRCPSVSALKEHIFPRLERLHWLGRVPNQLFRYFFSSEQANKPEEAAHVAPDKPNTQECCQNINLSLDKEPHTDKMLSCAFQVRLKPFCVPRVHSRPHSLSEALFNNSLFLLIIEVF